MRAAFDSGADGVEVDLRLTFDGVLAVSHDLDLTRLTGSPAMVSTSRWDELQDVAAASGVTLARSEDVLVIAAGRRVVLEVKAPPPGPAAAARTGGRGEERASCWESGMQPPGQLVVYAVGDELVLRVEDVNIEGTPGPFVHLVDAGLVARRAGGRWVG